MNDTVSIDRLADLAEEHLVPLAIGLVLAFLILVAGRWGARIASRLVSRLLRRAGTEESVVVFLTDLVYAGLMVMVVIAALERVGVETSAAVAVIGAAGLAIGLALQGSLGNFAAGVLIILFKPYRVGDTVQVAGKLGTVEQVHIFTTVLHTDDRRRVIIPNGAITAASIENFSALGTRRLALHVAVGGEELARARETLARIVAEAPRVLTEPPPQVSLLSLGPDRIVFAVHVSVESTDLGAVQADIMERAEAELGERLVEAKAA